MTDIRFPAIIIRKKGVEQEGIAGLKLKSLICAELMATPYMFFNQEDKSPTNNLNPQVFQRAKEAFLNAISSMLKKVTLELQWSSLPDLEHQPRGVLWFSLFLRSAAIEEDNIRQELIRTYLTIRPLLSAYFPEMELVPITDHHELSHRFEPFIPRHQVSIWRRRATVSLSTPISRNIPGFGKTEPNVPQNASESVDHVFPWMLSLEEKDPFVKTIMGQFDPLQIIIRIRHAGCKERETRIERLKKNIQCCEEFLSGIKSQQITLAHQSQILRDISLQALALNDGPTFNVGVYVFSPNPVDDSIPQVIGKTLTGPTLSNDLSVIYQGGINCKSALCVNFQDVEFYPEPEDEPFGLSEAACALLMPGPPKDDICVLPVKRSRSAMAVLPTGIEAAKDGILLFLNEHQGLRQPVYTVPDERMRHMFIAGQTGVGKSTFLETMILSDIRAGRGCGVIDPHGDMVDAILSKIPVSREKDVILFDVMERKRPIGYNLLQFSNIEDRDLIIDELYQTLDNLYDMQRTGGPIFEANFRGMMKLLMGDHQREQFIPTILDFTRCYLDDNYRKKLLEGVKDQQIIDFVNELERTGGDASLQNLSPYITSKFSRFIQDSTLKRIIGQEKTGFDFDRIMNDGKIFLVKLGRGRFGANVSALIANQLVSGFKQAAMKRGNLPPDMRRDFFLYIDECSTLPAENFTDLLSEARKFRMGLILSTQYTAQLKKPMANGNNLLSAVLGNVGSIILFRLGQEDAAGIAQILYPWFTMQDIVGLPNWNGYARLNSRGGSIPPFSFISIKDQTPSNTKRMKSIVHRSRRLYGTPVKKIDDNLSEKVQKWL